MPQRIAVIAGDGIGTEVMPEGLRVLNAIAHKFALELDFQTFEFGSCDYYLNHGKMLPDDWFEQLEGFDALFYGAVGWPDTVPDHISLWGSLLQFRRRFDQYINLRPCKLMPGIKSPLAGRAAPLALAIRNRRATRPAPRRRDRHFFNSGSHGCPPQSPRTTESPANR